MLCCVCYIPPSGSTRDVNHEEYFDILKMQVHDFQNCNYCMVLGDINSCVGNSEDFIPGDDDIPPREVLDHTANIYCETFIEFCVTTNCYM